MRILVLAAVLAVGCHKAAPTVDDAPVYRFLPAKPDLVVRLDLDRVRAWPMYGKAAPIALRRVQPMLEATKRVCNLDVLAEARTLIVASRGSLIDGDVTVVVGGLAAPKVSACLVTLQKSDTAHLLTLDGDAFHIKSLASGAILPSGEVVVVTRNGKGVEAAAWKTELGAAAGAAPAYWSELDATDPVATRIAGTTTIGTFSANLADPLVVRGKLVASDPTIAAERLKQLQAAVEYMKQADVGTIRLEPKDTTIHADLTATGAQIDRLITMALPAMFGSEGPDVAARVADIDAPRDCSVLTAAVGRYLHAGVAAAGANGKGEMEALVAKVEPKLAKAFVDRCTEDAWSASSIACHVTNAEALGRFEKCRDVLTEDQRTKLDKAIAEATRAP